MNREPTEGPVFRPQKKMELTEKMEREFMACGSMLNLTLGWNIYQVNNWFNTPNKELNGVPPAAMILMGKGPKLKQWVKERCIEQKRLEKAMKEQRERECKNPN